MLRLTRPLVAAWLCAALTFAQGAARQTPADDDVAGWTRLLLDRQNAAIELLAARGPACLPLLRQLCRDGRENVLRGVARTCERLGPDASPMSLELLATLRGPAEWWTHLYAAQALIAIGNPDEALLDALLDTAIHSPVPRLREVCTRGLAALAGDATRRVLTAYREGTLHDADRTVEILVALGDAVVPAQTAQLARCAEYDLPRPLLEEALARRGWQIVRQLERDGLPELAQQALRRGPLQDQPFAEHFELRHDAPIPPIARLPRIDWEHSPGKGMPLTLLRAEERPEGFTVSRVQVRYAQQGVPSAHLDRTVVQRARAADAVRQLELLAVAELQQVTAFGGRGWSSADRYDRVHMTRDGAPDFDEDFDGHPTPANLTRRFRAAAARVTLDQLLQGAVWQPRDADDADRQQVRAALARDGNSSAVVAHLRHLEQLLAPKRD
ncbi:MAG: hypothetical protein KDC48_13515 [Planctomycetes bacterium]|nr:hypothetical protein [Planctomycetota bacterium]